MSVNYNFNFNINIFINRKKNVSKYYKMKLQKGVKNKLSLGDYTTKDIRKFIQKFNVELKIKGYSKFNKSQMIDLINKHKLTKVVSNDNGVSIVINPNTKISMMYDFAPPKKVIIKKKILRKKKPPPSPPKSFKEINELISKASTKEELLEIKKKYGTNKENIKMDIKDKPSPKKVVKKNDLLTLMDKFNKKYNAVEIKKQNLNKSNLKDFTEPYFKELEKIEKEVDNVDDSIEFLKTNKKISSEFVDIKKNFVRRVKAQIKVKKEEPSPKKVVKVVKKIKKSVLEENRKKSKELEKELEEEEKAKQKTYIVMESKFLNLRTRFKELSYGLNEFELKQFKGDVETYKIKYVKTTDEKTQKKIKAFKTILQKDYNKLNKIFLGKLNPTVYKKKS